MENPYSSPQTAPSEDAPSLSPERERLAEIGEVLVAWEWLRIWYNVILAVVALLAILLLAPSLLVDLASLETMVAAAIGANACFFAGPIFEGYVTWWWRPAQWLRMPVFVIGTLGACLLTFIVVAFLASNVGVFDIQMGVD